MTTNNEKKREVQNYIDGSWREPSGSIKETVHNPATMESLANLSFSSDADLDRAVTAANEAFEDWQSRAVEDRIQPLFELKNLLEDTIDELTETLVTDHGKTQKEARGELRRGIENIEVACGIPTMMQAGALSHAAPGIDESAIRKPLGVFAGITPFNFPAMISLWFLPHAVATGNTFILKPSEQDPLVVNRIMELVDQAGFPDGVVNLVHGGPDIVNEILTHDGIEGVSFVGSSPVARHVYETGAAHGNGFRHRVVRKTTLSSLKALTLHTPPRKQLTPVAPVLANGVSPMMLSLLKKRSMTHSLTT
jgi:malonate-semialdehyde dehydrogenase (acetylating)/methylmalonate-semialdehyde dehydrogenase